KPAPPQAQSKRSVSVVIAARAAGRAVADKVNWLLQNTDSATQMVVVLDGPDPEAEAALAKLGTERLLVTVLPGAPGKWAALNRGVATARGDVIVFADVRPRIGQGAIARLVAALDSPDVGAAAAAFDTEPGSRPHVLELYWKLERWIRGNEAAFDSCIGTSGCLYALERSCWKPLPAGLLLD